MGRFAEFAVTFAEFLVAAASLLRVLARIPAVRDEPCAVCDLLGTVQCRRCPPSDWMDENSKAQPSHPYIFPKPPMVSAIVSSFVVASDTTSFTFVGLWSPFRGGSLLPVVFGDGSSHSTPSPASSHSFRDQPLGIFRRFDGAAVSALTVPRFSAAAPSTVTSQSRSRLCGPEYLRPSLFAWQRGQRPRVVTRPTFGAMR